MSYPRLSAGVNTKPKVVVSGGTLTSDSTHYYNTFTSSGTLTIVPTGSALGWAGLDMEILIVGGGGSPQPNYTDGFGAPIIRAGGGGGGVQKLSGKFNPGSGSYTVTIGAGAALSTTGGTTSVSTVDAIYQSTGGGSLGESGVPTNAGASTANQPGSFATVPWGSYCCEAISYCCDGDEYGCYQYCSFCANYCTYYAIFYAGGAGAGGASANAVYGVNYGGANRFGYGAGGTSNTTTPSAGAANTGNGGDNGSGYDGAARRTGGSGLVVFKYLRTDTVGG
jgi:hypothetical protein